MLYFLGCLALALVCFAVLPAALRGASAVGLPAAIASAWRLLRTAALIVVVLVLVVGLAAAVVFVLIALARSGVSGFSSEEKIVAWVLGAIVVCVGIISASRVSDARLNREKQEIDELFARFVEAQTARGEATTTDRQQFGIEVKRRLRASEEGGAVARFEIAFDGHQTVVRMVTPSPTSHQ